MYSPPSSGNPKRDQAQSGGQEKHVRSAWQVWWLMLAKSWPEEPRTWLDFKGLLDPLKSSHFSVGTLKWGEQNLCPAHPFFASCEQLDPFPNPCSHESGNKVLSPQKSLLMPLGGAWDGRDVTDFFHLGLWWSFALPRAHTSAFSSRRGCVGVEGAT